MCDYLVAVSPHLLSFVPISICHRYVFNPVFVVIALDMEHKVTWSILDLVVHIFIELMGIDIGEVSECFVTTRHHNYVEEVSLAHQEIRQP